jgi:hypothetical protein
MLIGTFSVAKTMYFRDLRSTSQHSLGLINLKLICELTHCNYLLEIKS